MTSTKKIISGAAIGTLLGSLAALIYPKRYEIIERVRDHSADLLDLTEKAKEYGESLINKGKQFQVRKVQSRNRYLSCGLLGLLIGAGSALLLAPKSGKNLRGQISRAYNDLSEKSEEIIHQFSNNNHNPFSHAHVKHNGVHKKRPVTRKKAIHHK